MVTRCSAVIPELKGAYFKCLTCGASPEIVVVNRGRVNEPPLKCLECRNQGTMTLIHNRCYFANKQQVKMQETPDVIPEGATPNTVSMCVFDSLVDEAKPGDRVEVTGCIERYLFESRRTNELFDRFIKRIWISFTFAKIRKANFETRRRRTITKI